MAGFWTEAEAEFHRIAAAYFRRLTDRERLKGAPGAETIWRDLEGEINADKTSRSRNNGRAGRVSVCEEAACHDPKLGRELLAWRAAAAPLDPLEEMACRLGRLAGTAAHVVEAGARAARERGSFSSSLMGCREVQESLAGLVSGAGLVRLGACRLCRLLERGDRERAGRESAELEARARALSADLRAVAGSLLGEPWVEANIPAEDLPFHSERKPR